MLANHLATLFERDIQKVKSEIVNYQNEENIWLIAASINNSGGNLCLHLLGNLQYYIGQVLGRSGYTRNRPEEFSRKNVPVAQLCEELDRVAKLIPVTIRSITNDQLQEIYPEVVFQEPMTTEYFLLHLYAHLNYHLGQINYHRRLLDTKK